jgi:hypothetical protein
MHLPAGIAVLFPTADFIYHPKEQLLPKIGEAI